MPTSAKFVAVDSIRENTYRKTRKPFLQTFFLVNSWQKCNRIDYSHVLKCTGFRWRGDLQRNTQAMVFIGSLWIPQNKRFSSSAGQYPRNFPQLAGLFPVKRSKFRRSNQRETFKINFRRTQWIENKMLSVVLNRDMFQVKANRRD